MIDRFINEVELKKKNYTEYEIIKLCKQHGISADDFSSFLLELEKRGILYKDGKEYAVVAYYDSYVIGKVNFTKSGNAYVKMDDKVVRLDSHVLEGVVDGDIVLVDTKTEGIKKIIARDSQMTFLVKKNGSECALVPYGCKCNIDVQLKNYDTVKLLDGEIVLIDISLSKYKDGYLGNVIRLIGHKDDADVELKAIAANHGVYDGDSIEVIRELNQLPYEVSNEVINEELAKGRVDLRNEMVFTIDGIDTKDIDDAISLSYENGIYTLKVSIADVSYYVKEGSAIYDAAYERGNSYYMLDSVIPMLSRKLSNGICSLNPNCDRLTFTCELRIDEKGNVLDTKIYESIINSRKKMNYDDVNSVLKGKDVIGYEEYEDNLRLMNRLSKILTSKRQERGFINFDLPELKVIIEDNVPKEFKLKKQHMAEFIIENFMLVTNEAIANYAFWMKLPFVNRVHELPSEEKLSYAIDLLASLGYKIRNLGILTSPVTIRRILKSITDEEKYPILSTLLLKSMKLARYDTQSIGHFALALDHYSGFTSPIRKLSNLKVHMLLKKYLGYNLDVDGLEGLESSLEDLCTQASKQERVADAMEDEANRFKMAQYMEDKIGVVYNGRITSISEYGVFIQTDNNVMGKVEFSDILGDYFIYYPDSCSLVGKKTKIRYKIGDSVVIRVKEASSELRTVNFILEGNNSLDKVKKLER